MELLKEVPETQEETKKGWSCPVCGTINNPNEKTCANECVIEENKENNSKQVLIG